MILGTRYEQGQNICNSCQTKSCPWKNLSSPKNLILYKSSKITAKFIKIFFHKIFYLPIQPIMSLEIFLLAF